MADRRAGRRINPAVIVVGVVIGLVYLGLGVAQDDLGAGIAGLVVMLLVTGALVIGSRFSDTVALLGDDVREERHVQIHQRAALFTINLTALVVVIAGIVDFASGGDGTPYTWLAAVIAVCYVGSVLVLSRRM